MIRDAVRLQQLCGLLVLLLLLGCSKEDRNWKETVPVTGEIYVKGKAAEGVHVTFHPEGGLDTTQPTETKAMTGKDGKFAASTYEVGDGATLGVFRLTFTWPKLNQISMTFDGDTFKGRYSKPERSKHTITVKSGEPIDLGRIELK